MRRIWEDIVDFFKETALEILKHIWKIVVLFGVLVGIIAGAITICDKITKDDTGFLGTKEEAQTDDAEKAGNKAEADTDIGAFRDKIIAVENNHIDIGRLTLDERENLFDYYTDLADRKPFDASVNNNLGCLYFLGLDKGTAYQRGQDNDYKEAYNRFKTAYNHGSESAITHLVYLYFYYEYYGGILDKSYQCVRYMSEVDSAKDQRIESLLYDVFYVFNLKREDGQRFIERFNAMGISQETAIIKAITGNFYKLKTDFPELWTAYCSEVGIPRDTVSHEFDSIPVIEISTQIHFEPTLAP